MSDLVKANGVAMAREGFGERSIATTGEQQQSRAAALATAAVNARFISAMQRPRNWDDVRIRILNECKRPGFAKAARYRKPIGKGIVGPSIRFAEACFRHMGNCDAPVTTIYEDRYVRRLSVQTIDYETNASFSTEITIEKTVERRDNKDRVVVDSRTNSTGATVYIVECTEDELLNKQNALVSKAVRTLILRLIPGDIVDEGQEQCCITTEAADQKDPRAATKTACDAFASVGVMPADIARYLGHSIDVPIPPVELRELKELYTSIRDGETTWAAIVEAKHGKADEVAPEKETIASRVAGRVQKTRETIDAKTGEVKAAREPGEEG